MKSLLEPRPTASASAAKIPTECLPKPYWRCTRDLRALRFLRVLRGDPGHGGQGSQRAAAAPAVPRHARRAAELRCAAVSAARQPPPHRPVRHTPGARKSLRGPTLAPQEQKAQNGAGGGMGRRGLVAVQKRARATWGTQSATRCSRSLRGCTVSGLGGRQSGIARGAERVPGAVRPARRLWCGTSKLIGPATVGAGCTAGSARDHARHKAERERSPICGTSAVPMRGPGREFVAPCHRGPRLGFTEAVIGLGHALGINIARGPPSAGNSAADACQP